MKYLLKYWYVSLSAPIILGAFIFYNFPTGINEKTIMVFIIWCLMVLTTLIGFYYSHKAGADSWAKSKIWGQIFVIILYLIYIIPLILLLMFALATIK